MAKMAIDLEPMALETDSGARSRASVRVLEPPAVDS
jgi:hypothetical protein